MKKIYTLCLLGLLLAHVGYSQAITNISQHLPGKKMSSITFNNKGIGVATSLDQGFFYSFDNGKTWTQESTLKDYRINQVVADVSGTFWLATTGTAASGRSATLGGIKSVTFDANKRMTVIHFFPQTKNGVKTGIPSRYVESIATEPSGAVFSAHNYDALVAVGPVVCDTYTDPNGIQVSTNCRSDVDKLFNGGGLGMKTNGQSVFSEMPLVTNIFQTNDITCYPRGCSSVLASNNEVWIAINNWSQTDPLTNCNANVPSQILTYTNTNGKLTLKSRITNQNTPSLPLGTNRVFAMHQSKNRYWIGFNANKGLAVYENNIWNYLPIIGTIGKEISPTVNPNAIFSDENTGKVFIGTTQGLAVFNRAANGDIIKGSFNIYDVKDGLPSNNVLGGWAKNDTVYLSTDNGVAKITFPSASLFRIISSNNTLRNARMEAAIPRKKIVSLLSDNVAALKGAVAADGSRNTTLIALKGYQLSDFTGLSPKYKIYFKEDQTGQNKDEYGTLTEPTVNSDTIFYKYQHPKFIDANKIDKSITGRLITLIIWDINANIQKQSFLIKVMLPPALLIHGVLSNGDLAFGRSMGEPEIGTGKRDGLYNGILSSGFYADFMVAKPSHHLWIDYEKPTCENTLTSLNQAGIIKNEIDAMKKRCSEFGLSVGKVDIICHSRGGLLTRLYLQSDECKLRDDVNKVITMDTPHYGTQVCNLLVDERYIVSKRYNDITNQVEEGLKSCVKVWAKLGSDAVDDNKTAAPDMMVDSKTITSLNAAENRAKWQGATHLIGSTVKFEGYTPEKVLTVGVLVFLNLYAAFVDLTAPKLADGFFTKIFHDESDILVPISSQLLGNPIGSVGTTHFPNTAHSESTVNKLRALKSETIRGVTFKKEAIDRVLELLKAKESDDKLFTRGFIIGKESTLKYDFLEDSYGKTNKDPSTYPYAADLPYEMKEGCKNEDCNSPANGNKRLSAETAADTTQIVKLKNLPQTIVKAGKTIVFSVKGGSKVSRIFLTIQGGNIDIHSQLGLQTNIMNVTFPIPKQALGKLRVEVWGTDNNASFLVSDTASINVGLPDNAKLMGIKIANNKPIAMKEKQTLPISIQGIYSDTIRYLDSKLATFLIKGGSTIIAGVNKNEVYAKKTGSDWIIANYQGKADSAKIDITDNEFLYSTIFSLSSVSINDNNLKLNWSTSNEYRTRNFSVQRKIDKNNFETIKTPKANGNTPSNYALSDSLILGNITYRIIATDSLERDNYSTDIIVPQLRTKLADLKINTSTNGISLTWTAFREVKNIGFEVWRGTDSTKLIKITPTLIKGKTTNLKEVSYSYIDSSAPSGKLYYQIRATDETGFVSNTVINSFVRIITATEPIPATTFAVFYPNPVDKVLLCQCPVGAKNILIYGTDGKLLMQQSIDGSSSKIDVSKLAGGLYVYLLQSKTGEVIQSGKFLKQ